MLYLKDFYSIVMGTWFTGLFYLPRLFVYHAMSDDPISIDRFKIMQRKLVFGIMSHGAIITIGPGIWLISKVCMDTYDCRLHAKLALVAILIVYHIYCEKLIIDFKHDRNTHSHVFYR